MYNLGNADKNMLVSTPMENKYYDSAIEIDKNDTNNTHSIIAMQVKDNSTCLDVGCGAGYIGKLLESKNCTIYGVDVDAESLMVTDKLNCYKELCCFSITDDSSDSYKDFMQNNLSKFDYIFFADVLEHVVNPDKVLMEFSKLLKKNGKILVSVPNVAHIDIIKELVNRTFNYNKIGILDNTHLRFFTKASFYDFVMSINEVYNTNFQIKMIGKTISKPWYIDNYHYLLECIDKDSEICVLQYVYELSINEASNKKNSIEYNDYFSAMEEKLANASKLELENSKIEQENVRLNRVISELNGQLKQHQNIINSMLNSKSWKITSPLRKLSGLKNKKGLK